MRIAILSLWLLLAAGPALATPTLDELAADPARKKEIDRGLKILNNYFRADAEIRKPRQRKGPEWTRKRDEALKAFLLWLDNTPGSLGVDLGAQADDVIEMLDRSRAKYLESKYKKGRLEYVRLRDPRGMQRHEYAILVPKSYTPKTTRTPVVISLHGRVINTRHPAFRSAGFAERSRVTIWNNWLKSPAADDVLVIAPTASPDGFVFSDATKGDEVQALYRTLIEVLTKYRVDWNRIFLEVQGEALRACCEQGLMFAGFILRDRVENRRKPFIPKEEWFMFENLNGIPLLYIADEKHWEKVGKPMSEALAKAYQKAGAPENFTVVKGTRNSDGALTGHGDTIRQFLQRHKRPKVRRSFVWRFHKPSMASPLPIDLDLMNTNYDVSPEAKKAPLSAKAGKITFDVTLEKGKRPYNRVVINVTEAESLRLWLYAGLIDFDLPTTIVVNGETLIDQVTYERDWGEFFRLMLPGRFFMMPTLSSVELKFKHVPQFVPPVAPAEKKEAGKEAEKEGEKKAAAQPADDKGAAKDR